MNRIILILLYLTYQTGYAQPFFKKTPIQAMLGTIISSDSLTPFLLRSKQYGLVPVKSGFGYLNLSLKKEYDSLYTTTDRKLKRLDYGYGLETHLNIGRVNQILIPVAHFKVRYGAFELYGGRRREIQGLVDTLGTMGSYIWSGNALPMPKIEISIPNYTPIMKNGLIAIKGNFAHGWFGKADSVQNVLLHQKSFYARIGKPTWKVHLIGGFNHQVQWGGYPTKPFFDEISQQTISKFGNDFGTFFKISTGVRLNKDGIGWNNQAGIPANEAGNRVGNHLGTIDIGLNTHFRNHTLLIYKQSIFEDGSLFYLSNVVDGLYGIAFKSPKGIIKHVNFEYFYTLNQGGDAFEFQPQLRGRDNYFNNSLYKDNWTYKNEGIGSPLIQGNDILRKSTYFDNRIKAISFNIHYRYRDVILETKVLQICNFGTYFVNKDLKQLSYLQQIQKKFGKYIVCLNLAIDSKKDLSRNVATNLSIQKIW